MEKNDVKSHPLLESWSKFIEALNAYKPNDRSEIDRRFAIAITEAEKLAAYLEVYLSVYLERSEE